MKKIMLYIDCDGVILDTIRKAELHTAAMGLDPNSFDDVHEFCITVDWNYFIYEAGILNDSIRKIRRIIIEHPEYDVAILTKLSGNETEEYAKRRFFSIMLPGIPVITLPLDYNKDEVVDPVGNIIIEDSVSNADRWDRAGGVAVRFFVGRECDFEENIINDLSDFDKTSGVKRLLKAMNI